MLGNQAFAEVRYNYVVRVFDLFDRSRDKRLLLQDFENPEAGHAFHDDIRTPILMRSNHITYQGGAADIFPALLLLENDAERRVRLDAMPYKRPIAILENMEWQTLARVQHDAERKEGYDLHVGRRGLVYTRSRRSYRIERDLCRQLRAVPYFNGDSMKHRFRSMMQAITGRFPVQDASGGLVCAAVVCAVFTLASVTPAAAQRVLFGSIDDPAEQSSVAWWQAYTELEAAGGLSLVGPQWRTAGRLAVETRTTTSSVRIDGTVRTGVYGTYDPDIDETYDLLRLLEYARYRPPESGRYARIGPLERTRLGTGHLVNFLNSNAVWDRRTIGVEASLMTDRIGLQSFSSEITDLDLLGGRLWYQPLPQGPGSAWRTIRFGVTAVTDQRIEGSPDETLEAGGLDADMEAVRTGGFSFRPFFSYSRIRTHGQGFYFGGDLSSENLIDLARVHLRLALHYSSSEFRPGYFGSFYSAAGPGSVILSAEEESDPGFVSLDLEDAGRGNAVVTELRLLIFERFELWYQFVRHHGVLPESEYHLRLFFNSNRLRLAIGQDRGSLKGFFSLFDDLEDLSLLHFDLAYRVSGPLWVSVDARYTYDSGIRGEDGRRRYIVQRRFDPLVSLRFRY